MTGSVIANIDARQSPIGTHIISWGLKPIIALSKNALLRSPLNTGATTKSIFQIPEKYLSITMGATVASITTIGVGIPIVISMTGIIWNGWQLWLCSTAFTQTDHIRLLLQIP